MANETRDQPWTPEKEACCFQNLILYYHWLTAHCQEATTESCMGKCHWYWPLNSFYNFYNQNLTHMEAYNDNITFSGKATQMTLSNQFLIVETYQKWIQLGREAGRQGPGGGASAFYWLLTHSASYSSEALKMFSKHTSLNHNVNSIYWKAGTFNITTEPI